MKRIIAIGTSIVVTVVLGIIVLTAGQPRTTSAASQSGPAGVTIPAPASDTFALPQFETGDHEHESGEHEWHGTSNPFMNDD